MRPHMANLAKARESRVIQPPMAVRAEELHRAARDILLGVSTTKPQQERNHVLKDDKTMMILKAIDNAGRPLRYSEIADRIDLSLHSIIWHIKWRMLNTLLRVEKEETDRNQRPILFFGITSWGYVKLEAT